MRIAIGLLALLLQCAPHERAASVRSPFVAGPGMPNAERPASELFKRISPIMGKRHLNQPAVVNQTLFLGGNGEHEIWNIADPSAPVRLSELLSPHRAGEAESHQLSFARFPDGSLHAVTISGKGIDLWDISNPSSPRLESTVVLEGIDYGDFTAAVWGVSWQGNVIYAGGTNTGLHVIDATDPSAPRVLRRIPTSQLGGVSAGPLFALGNLLVVTTPKESAGIATLDIGDPARPTLLDAVRPAVKSYIGGFYGKHAFLQAPFRTYDVTTDPRHIREIGSFVTPLAEYASFADSYAFVGSLRTSAGGKTGILKYDITDPGALRLMGHVLGRDDPGTDDQFSVPIGNLVAIADDEHLFGAYLAVHDTRKDTTPPSVLYVHPREGSSGHPPTTRIAVSFSDQIELTSVDASTFVVRPVGGQPIAGRWGIVHTVVSFWPERPLAPGTTYEIVLSGVKDLVGNAMAPFRSSFSVAAATPALPCAIETKPVLADSVARLSTPDTGHEYSWKIGGEKRTGATVDHVFTEAGRYPITLTVSAKTGGSFDHYEAEDATLAGGVAPSTEHAGYSGAGYADYPASQGTVTWRNVYAAHAGTHDVVIRFANGDGARRLRARVNGGAPRVVDFPASDWKTWATVTVPLVLDAGSNVIELAADDGTAGPNLDRLSVPAPESTSCSAVQIVHRPLLPERPARSSTVALDGDKVWAVSPDAGTVTAVDISSGKKLVEVPVGKNPRTVARAPDGGIWVASQGSDELHVLDTTGKRVNTVALPYGSNPYGIVFGGTRGYVTFQSTGKVAAIDPVTCTVSGIADLGGGPLRGIAGDSSRLLVTRFHGPEVLEIDSALAVKRQFRLGNAPGPDTPDQARGIPNYLSSIAISPDGVTAWIPSKQDNLSRGLARDGQALTHDATVRPIVSRIDLAGQKEDPRIDLNDASMPFAVEVSPFGDLIFVALQGNNRVEVRDAYSGAIVGSISAGRAPEGLVLDGRGRLLVSNVTDRTLTIVDASRILAGTDDTATTLATIPLVEKEPLSAAVLRGKQIFHDASDKRMSKESYISCASCHLDGDQDGQVWDFTDRGEGLRNTISMLGRRGTGHGRLHWTANFDEVQDFENDIRKSFGGTGFLSDTDFEARKDPLAAPKAGVSEDLDALAAYVASLDTVPRSPFRREDGTLTAEGLTGKQVFAFAGCASCHAGSDFTDGERHDIGTQGRFDTPTLVGVWSSAPYFHDGSAKTLRDVMDRHAATLTAEQKEQLVAYLLQLDGNLSGEPHPPEGCGCDLATRPSHWPAALTLGALIVLARRRASRPAANP
jgi:cytochrome c peroxidase